MDRLAGETWTCDVFAYLPRETTMLAADSRRLYVGQWGGWSEFDGKGWTHHFEQKILQKAPMTALYPQGDTLWIGTQNRGLAEYRHTAGELRWHDEREGLPDDWITTITGDGKSLSIGTFVGGMMRWDGKRWTPPVLAGQNVTAFASGAAGGEWIATRAGLWHRSASGALTSVHPPFLDSEIQALLAMNGGPVDRGAHRHIFPRSKVERGSAALRQNPPLSTHLTVSQTNPPSFLWRRVAMLRKTGALHQFERRKYLEKYIQPGLIRGIGGESSIPPKK